MDNFMDRLAQKLNAQEMIKANSAAEAEQIEQMNSQIAEYDAALQEIRKLGLKNAEAADKLNRLMEESGKRIDELTKESVEKIQAIQAKEDGNAEVKAQLKELSEAIRAGKDDMQEIAKKTEAALKRTEDTYQKAESTFKKTEATFQKTEAAFQKTDDTLKKTEATFQKTESTFKKTEATFQKTEDTFQKAEELFQRNEELFKKTEELFKKTEEYIHTEDIKVYRNVEAVLVEETEKQTEAIARMQAGNGKKLTVLLAVGVLSLIGILANVALNLAQVLNWKLF